jgi:hypothetical protein
MGKRQFHFIEEPEEEVSRNYWMVRMIICGVIAGCAASAYILLNFTRA